MTACSPAPRKSQLVDAYDKALKLEPLRTADRLGLVLLHHQADVQAIDWFFRLVGNFGIAILIVTVLVKIALLPARQQVLRLDGEDEGGAAGDDGDPRALRATTR